MNALLEGARRIGRDLVAKRLWPIALALLAAVVAVPMLIGSTAAEPPPPGPVAAPGPAATAPAPIPPGDAGTGSRRAGGGPVRDPFYDPPKPPAEPGDKPAAGAQGEPTTAVAKPAGGTDAASPPKAAPAPTGSKTPPAATSSSKASPAARASKPKPATVAPASRYYRAVVRWGGSTTAGPHAIARLTPLGGRRNPAALYLGVTRADATYAVFVLGPNATSHGGGACRAGTDCRMIALKIGQKRSFVVHSPDGGRERRFTLRVQSLRAVHTNAAAARRGRAKVHRHGRSVLRAMRRLPTQAAVLRRAIYDQRIGLLRTPATGAVKNASE